MANELLDFVMSLVRDPDAAARYAENPQQAIADAHLTDVTSVDVNNLIPVVSESMSSLPPAASTFGAEPVPDANVWASGAATAAFDAFSEHVPAPAVVDTHHVVVDQPAVFQPETVTDLPTFDAGMFDQPLTTPDAEVHDVAPAAETDSFDPGFHHLDDHHGFGDPGPDTHLI